MARRLFVPLTTALLAIACGNEPPPPEPVIRPVRSQLVYASGSGRARSFAGTSQATLESRLSFKVPGTVSAVAVRGGESVSEGALIARLDDQDFRLQVEEAEAGLNAARAQSRNAQAAYSRVRALYENRNASTNDLDAARAAAESAQAQVRSSEQRTKLAKAQLSYTRLTSPVAGSIASLPVQENENVAPGQTVALLTSGSQLEVAVSIPEALIADIREGDSVSVRFDAITDRTFSGRVLEVGVSPTGSAAAYPVVVRLDETDGRCRPGMAAEVTFRFDAHKGQPRLLVPAVAVGEDRQGRYVFVLEEGDTAIARRRSVEVGDIREEGIEVLSGLSDGDRVVTAGVTRILDGQKVRLLEN